ncbi:flagellar basal body-associated FliL family protein [Marinilactibacillus sp. XAAS-LB27]|uniref:flagellar basal body-associated FliL family protein n=1 Tax=Marinilactibacillus sp. XAAS-LB27 TaxID=3114538 RepID=UPI002E196986|nr:flagellar basal body-associated FliL family protein [Marinilactibacillus sp. XAAS-LB27]
MAENQATQTNSKNKGGKSKLIIILLVTVVLALVGVVGFILLKDSENIPIISNLTKEPEPVEVQVPLEEFLINVGDDSGRNTAMVKLEVSVSSYADDAEVLINQDIAKVRDAVIHVVSNENIDSLLEREDESFVLKRDIKDRINQSFGTDLIDDVYITNILTQN